VLFKRPLDEDHIGLALGECVAHLNYLYQRGQLERVETPAGRFTFRSVDGTLQQRLRQGGHQRDDEPLQV